MAKADSGTMRWLWLILVVGLGLRMLHAIDQPTLILFRHGGGGDSGWYLANGAGFFSGKEHGYIRGISYYISALPTPPFYILFSGIFQTFLTKHESVVVIRIIQSLISVGTAYLAFRICGLLARDPRAALIAAALIALHPAFIVESTTIATETFYVFFVCIAFWLYLGCIVAPDASSALIQLSGRRALILTALAMGMATLTRAVFVLFPLVVLAHLLLLEYRRRPRQSIRRGLFMLAIYCALVSTWTIYNWVMWDRLMIVSNQFMPAMWRGAITTAGSPQENDALLLQDVDRGVNDDCEVDCKFEHATETYLSQIVSSVGEGPADYLLHRLGELGYAVLQPHGTIPLGSTSIKAAFSDWWTGDKTINGLVQIARIEGFAVKLVIWVLHLLAIGLGLVGMWMSRASWRLTLPLMLFAAYTITLHAVLYAEPRYLFPIEIIWLIFAAITTNALLNRLGMAVPDGRSASPSP